MRKASLLRPEPQMRTNRERVEHAPLAFCLLQNPFDLTQQRTHVDALTDLAELVDYLWTEQALAASGKDSVWRRKLPVEHAVWLVIGLSP